MNVLALLACAGLLGDGGAEPDVEYRFRLALEPRPLVQITLKTRGSEGSETFLEVVSSWGGVDAGGADIEGLVAHDAEGNILAVKRLSMTRWRVEHDPRAELEVTYDFPANENQAHPRPAVNRRPIVNEQLFHTVGHLGLVRVQGTAYDDPLVVRLSWEGFEEHGWSVMSSFGPGGATRTVDTTLGELLGSLYVAGELDVQEYDVHGSPVFVTIAGDSWTHDTSEFGVIAAEIVAAERAFFEDFERDFYWVSVNPVGQAGTGGADKGGSGLHNCFSLQLLPDAVFDPATPQGEGLLFLLAHESFHEWNGRVIRREDPEQLVYWFSEGFTNFYARRLLVRNGWVDVEGYARELNRRLADFYLSPVRDQSNQFVLEHFWRDRHYGKLPYQRGDVVALLVDHAIRRQSGAERNLDDLMRALLEDGRQGERVSTKSLLDKIEAFTDEPTAARIRAIVVDGSLPDLPEDLLAPCLELELLEQPMFDVGFELDASMQENRVCGVREGTSAHEAGLRDGQRLTSWSVYRGDTERPAVFTVVEDGAAREISYMPHGEIRQVPAFVPVAGADCSRL